MIRGLIRLAWLTVCLLLVGGLSGAFTPVAAQNAPEASSEPQAPLVIEITGLTPSAATKGSTITVSGSITNTTADPLPIEVTLSMATGRLTVPDQVQQASTGRSFYSQQIVPDGRKQLGKPLLGGASAIWSFTMSADDLPFVGPGVYQFNATGSSPGTGFSAETRTFLPFYPDKAQHPLQLVWLWPVSDAPNRDANDVLLNDRTPTEVAENGRLTTILNAGLGAKSGVDWVIDPQVLQTLNVMSRGYQVLGANGQPGPVTQSSDASRWMSKATDGLKDAQVYAMSYAAPDLTALARNGMTDDIAQTTAHAGQQVGSALSITAPTVLGWPAGFRTDQKTVDDIQATGVRTLILDTEAYPSNDGATDAAATINSSGGPLTAALFDRGLSNAIPKAGATPADVLRARQLFLATTAAMQTQSPYSSPTVVVAPGMRWSPDSAALTNILSTLDSQLWVKRVSLASALKNPVDSGHTLSPMSRANVKAGLSKSYLQTVTEQRQQVAQFSSVLAGTSSDLERLNNAILRTTSSAWRSSRGDGKQLQAAVGQQITDTMNKVRVLANQTVTFSRGEGNVPITIANDLDVPITVGVKLIGSPPVRLASDAVTSTTVPAKRKIQLSMPVRVRGAGELPVSIQLTNAAGVDYGTPATIKLRSTAYAQAASWIIAAAFIGLTILLVINSIRRRRQRDEADPTSEDPTPIGPTLVQERQDSDV